MQGNLEGILDILAERFGTTIEHLYEVMLRQAYIEAGASFLSIVFALAFVFFFLKKWQWKLMEWAKSDDDELLGVLGLIGGYLALVLALPSAILDARIIITILTNVDYWVINQILEALSG